MATEVLFPLFNKTGPRVDLPNGCGVVAVRDAQKKGKWAEIFCLFLRNDIRMKNGKTPREYWQSILVPATFSQPVWNSMVSVWSPTLATAYLDAEKSDNPTQAKIDLFDTELEGISGFRQINGKDYRGDVDLVDTWLWSPIEKSKFFPSQVRVSDSVIDEITRPHYVWKDGVITLTRKKRFTLDYVKPYRWEVDGSGQTGNQLNIRNSIDGSGTIEAGTMFTLQGASQTYTISSTVNYTDSTCLITFSPNLVFSPSSGHMLRMEDEGDDETRQHILNTSEVLEPRRNKRAGSYMVKACEVNVEYPDVEFDAEGNPIPL